MAQFVAAIAALNTESQFAAAYTRGVPKAVYWEYAYEDSMDLLAKLPIVAATIYRNMYRNGSSVSMFPCLSRRIGNLEKTLTLPSEVSYLKIISSYASIL